MKFGPRPVSQCDGAILAHSMKLENRRLKKGCVLTAEDIAAAETAGYETLIVAQLEPGDIAEDEAAHRLAEAIGLDGVTLSVAGTGRVNFHADRNGVFEVSQNQIDAINRIDPGITLATLENHEPVLTGRMVATVKIIPYAVSEAALAGAESICSASNIFSVSPYREHKVGVVSTLLPGLKDSVVTKTLGVPENRLSPSGSMLHHHKRVAHTVEAVAAALEELRDDCDMIIVFGASAISDEADVIPDALSNAGGHVERVGMPVDPGNLLMLGALGDVPVIGAPGCSRSPARNGFDFVLERLLAGISIDRDDIAGMGVGGLLMEIGSRPQPREISNRTDRQVEGILLAAGQSRRMGKANKLTLDIGGKPMVRHTGEAASELLSGLTVVTGHEADQVEAALGDLNPRFVHNADYGEGLSTSLKAGIAAVSSETTHAMVLLGDMPRIEAAGIRRLLDALGNSPPGSIIVATCEGKRGNPVIWPRAYFGALGAISGDTGARHLLGENREQVVEVELGEAASLDVDTPQAYKALSSADQPD